MLQKNRAKRTPAQIAGIVVIFVLAVLIILTFVLFGMFKGLNSAPKLFGYRVYVITNDRMEPRIPKGAAVFIEEGTKPQPGSQGVILCKIDGGLYVIGCVGTETDETGAVSYIVKYDNADDGRTWGISERDIIGVARKYDTFFGWLIRFASSKSGILLIVIIPCLLLIGYEVVMLLIPKKRSDGGEQSEPSQEHHADSVSLIQRIVGEPDPEDIPPEREDIHIPVDVKREERFVEMQLERADKKLNRTVVETEGKAEPKEIKLEEIDVKLEGAVGKPVPSLTAEPKIDKIAPAEPDIGKAAPAEKESASVGSISDSRIEELLKLLEEEKKRLEDK